MISEAMTETLKIVDLHVAVEGKPLTFAHLPPSLASLAQLYGVEDLLVAEPS